MSSNFRFSVYHPIDSFPVKVQRTLPTYTDRILTRRQEKFSQMSGALRTRWFLYLETLSPVNLHIYMLINPEHKPWRC